MPDYSEKFQKMRIAGKVAAETLDMLTNNIKPGVTTEFIDKLGYEFIRDNGAYSAPLYYRGFKKSLCTSLNHVVCHGIPSDRILVEGDAMNIDVLGVEETNLRDELDSAIANIMFMKNNLGFESFSSFKEYFQKFLKELVENRRTP